MTKTGHRAWKLDDRRRRLMLKAEIEATRADLHAKIEATPSEEIDRWLEGLTPIRKEKP